EAQAARRIERPLDAIRIQLAGPRAAHEDVPVVVGAVDRRVEADHPGCPRVVGRIEEQELHAGGVPREDAEIHAARRGRRSQRRAAACFEAVGHVLPRSSLADATTRSGWKPNFSWSAFRGAEAPKVRMPITRPAPPTYRSQPNVEACSIASRAVTSRGSTLSRYSGVC